MAIDYTHGHRLRMAIDYTYASGGCGGGPPTRTAIAASDIRLDGMLCRWQSAADVAQFRAAMNDTVLRQASPTKGDYR